MRNWWFGLGRGFKGEPQLTEEEHYTAVRKRYPLMAEAIDRHGAAIRKQHAASVGDNDVEKQGYQPTVGRVTFGPGATASKTPMPPTSFLRDDVNENMTQGQRDVAMIAATLLSGVFCTEANRSNPPERFDNIAALAVVTARSIVKMAKQPGAS